MESKNLKQAYEEQLKILKDWMASQKVYRELAARLMEKKT